MICGYAATEAGFTANIMVAGTDGLLQAITQRTADDFLAGEYHPAMTQLFYRLGDSMSNCITPFSPYIWVTLKAAQDFYDPKLKLGTLISNMIPIGIVISVVWIVFLIVWMVAGLPIGPAVPIFMSAK